MPMPAGGTGERETALAVAGARAVRPLASHTARCWGQAGLPSLKP